MFNSSRYQELIKTILWMAFWAGVLIVIVLAR